MTGDDHRLGRELGEKPRELAEPVLHVPERAVNRLPAIIPDPGVVLRVARREFVEAVAVKSQVPERRVVVSRARAAESDPRRVDK